jgi:adenine deaminase
MPHRLWRFDVERLCNSAIGSSFANALRCIYLRGPLRNCIKFGLSQRMKLTGNIVDIYNQRIFKGELLVVNGKIESILSTTSAPDQFILPGFIDAHVHIESSMLVPSEFARMAVVHGTVSTVSDPHEIGNVLGVEGVKFMIENGKKVPFKFNFGAPSCVPATHFETAGATIGVREVETLLQADEVKYLAEMMNWPGVLSRDSGVMAKISLAQKYKKVVDGHAPGLKGELAKNYVAAGISTDHECFTSEEALDKLSCGMKIIIREGSAAKNFEALADLLHDHSDNMMFCSDDKHPDSLEVSHINELCARAMAKGIDVFKVLKAACINPIHHYGLEVGSLRVGDPADFIVVKDLKHFKVLQTFIDGRMVAEHGKSLINSVSSKRINNFSTALKHPGDFKIEATSKKIRVIEAHDGQLITTELITDCKIENGFAVADVERDILKIVVVNRYDDATPAVAFIKNFGIKQGAIASSVGHDSHNIIAVGTDDDAICKAVNLVIKHHGGVAASGPSGDMILALPIAGIMSGSDGYEVASQYKAIDKMAKDMGSSLGSPFMTLSFMALLVIPSLKLSDKGLFNGDEFKFVNVFVP